MITEFRTIQFITNILIMKLRLLQWKSFPRTVKERADAREKCPAHYEMILRKITDGMISKSLNI